MMSEPWPLPYPLHLNVEIEETPFSKMIMLDYGWKKAHYDKNRVLHARVLVRGPFEEEDEEAA